MVARKTKTRIVNGEVVAGDETLTSSGGTTVDVFGFNLDVKQFLVSLAIISFLLGPSGTIALLIALGAYTCFNRITTSSASGITSPSSSGGGRRKQPGANIRGMKDLPCDPKVG